MLVPARDEEAVLPALLDCLAEQSGVARPRGAGLRRRQHRPTAEVVADAARRDPRVRLVHGDPASGRVARQAVRVPPAGREAHRLGPASSSTPTSSSPRTRVAATVALLRDERPGPRLAVPAPARRSARGRAAGPAAAAVVLADHAAAGPAERSPRASLAAANGQLLAVDAAAYRAGRGPRRGRRRGAGGHRPAAGGQAQRRPRGAVRRLHGRLLPDVHLLAARCGTATPSRCGRPSAPLPGPRPSSRVLGLAYVWPAAAALRGSTRRGGRARRRGARALPHRGGDRCPLPARRLRPPGVGAGSPPPRRGVVRGTVPGHAAVEGAGGSDEQGRRRRGRTGRAGGRRPAGARRPRGDGAGAGPAGGWQARPVRPRRVRLRHRTLAADHPLGLRGPVRRDRRPAAAACSTWCPVDPAFRYRFADGTVLDLPDGGGDPTAAAIEAALGEGTGAQWRAFMARAGQIWEATRGPFLGAPLDGARGLLRESCKVGDLVTIAPWQSLRLARAALPQGLPAADAAGPLRHLHRLRPPPGARRAGDHARTSSRPTAPGTSRGGLRRSRRRRRAAARWSAAPRSGPAPTSPRSSCGTSPDRSAGGRPGVRLRDGSTVEADVVVSNADAAHTYHELLAGPSRRARPASAAQGRPVAVRLRAAAGPARADTGGAAHHTVLFPTDYDDEFDSVFGTGKHRGRARPAPDPTVYIVRPRRPALRPDEDSRSRGSCWSTPRVTGPESPARGVDWHSRRAGGDLRRPGAGGHGRARPGRP